MNKQKYLNVILLQTAPSPNKQRNLDYICSQIHCQNIQSPSLIVLPELHNSNYFCLSEDHDNFALAEAVDGITVQTLAPLAKQYKSVIITSIFEERLPGIYHNTSVVIDSDGSIAGIYRKMHIPDDPFYYEKFYFTPGDLGFRPIQTALGKLGVLVCWDQWFPEAARLMALAGADILIYPTAIGSLLSEESSREIQLDAWRTIQRSHAIANGLYVLSVNRVGVETLDKSVHHGIDFWGSSFVADPFGQLIESADQSSQMAITCTIDLERTRTQRQTWSFLRDRRVDHYDQLLNIAAD